MIVTFYSYKGGVGRSMALVNVAELFASWGYRVILCDWDLEAPGLERYLVPMGTPLFRDRAERERYQAYIEQALAHEGLMDLLREYKEALGRTPAKDAVIDETEEFAAVGSLRIRRPRSRTYVPEGRTDDLLRVLSAGRRDGANLQKYADGVRDFDWAEFYDRWAGDSYLELFRKDLGGDPRTGDRGAADIVLIDSRTGVTEQGGVCTHHLADVVVLVTAPNEANVAGTKEMVRTLTDPALPGLRGGRPVFVLPVAARVDVLAERDLLNDFLLFFQEEVGSMLPPPVSRDYLIEGRIPYITYYSFRERVVTREPKSVRVRELYQPYTQLAAQILLLGLEHRLVTADHLPSELHPRPTAAAAEIPRRRPRGEVFLSYAAVDRDFAVDLSAALERRGVQQARPSGCVDDALLRAAAVLFVVGEGGLTQPMRAELDLLLKQSVTGTPQTIVAVCREKRFGSPLLAGFRTFVAPDDDAAGDSAFVDELIAELASPPAPVVDAHLKPYLGLQPYGEGEARLFFGRDEEASLAAAALARGLSRSVRWLRIEGTSGVGVTSFTRAALVPALRRGAVSEIPRDAIISHVTLTQDPLLNLAAALNIDPAITVDEVRSALTRPDTLCDYLRGLLRGRRMVLVVDGLHALHEQTVAAVAAFASAIETLLSDPLGVTLITTARRSVMMNMTLPGKLGELMGSAEIFELAGMSGEQMRSAITGPAAMQSVTFEPGLIDRITSDMAVTRDAPALLSVVLEKLWYKRSGTLLTHAAYVENGGIAGVVRELTGSCLGRFGPEDLEQARRIIMRLVSGVGTRLVRAPDAVLMTSDKPETMRRVLSLLVAGRVVLAHRDAIELTHDAVLTSSVVAAWLSNEKAALEKRAELELAARSWKTAGKPWSGLPTGAQLRYFGDVESNSPDVRAYVGAARRYERVRGFATAAVALAIGFFVVLGVMRSESEQRASDELSRLAMARLEHDPIDALRLALVASRDRKSPLQLEAVRKSIAASLKPLILRHYDRIESVLASRDGEIVAIKSPRAVDVWNVRKRRKIATLVSPVQFDLDMTADGARLIVGLRNARGQVWQVTPLKRLWDAPVVTKNAQLVANDDGSYVAAETAVTTLTVVETGTSAVTTRALPGRMLRDAPGVTARFEFLPNSLEMFVLGSGRVWFGRADSAQPFELVDSGSRSFSKSITSSGTLRFCLMPTDRGMVLWDLLEKRFYLLPGAPRLNGAAAIDGQGRYIAFGDGRSIVLLDRKAGSRRLITHRWGSVSSVALSPDGKRLATGGDGGSLVVWETEIGVKGGKVEHVVSEEGARISSLRFLGYDRVLAVTERTVRISDVDALAKFAADQDIDVYEFGEERLRAYGIDMK